MKKILILLLSLVLILSFLSGCKTTDENNTDKTDTVDSNTVDENTTDIYKDIINTYKEAVTAKKNGSEVKNLADDSKSERENAIFEAIYTVASDCEPDSMGYATKDINGDGTSELVFLTRNCFIRALFTIVDSKPVFVEVFDNRNGNVIDGDGVVYKYSSDTDTGGSLSVKKLNTDGKLVGLEFGYSGKLNSDGVEFFKTENGNRTVITKAEKIALDDQYTVKFTVSGRETKIAGFRFIPVIAQNSNETAFAVDFSSYNAIISTFRKIVSCYSDFREGAWIAGTYDSLFVFDNDTEYDIFNRLIYSGYCLRPKENLITDKYPANGNNAYGYDLYDFNGDGKDELILMRDSYEILAIFSMVDGIPVLIENFDNLEICWFEANGNIHIDKTNIQMNELVYTLGKIDTDGSFKVGICYGTDVKEYYRIQNGVKTVVSREEALSVYDEQIHIIPNGYLKNEYLKDFTSLEFSPLNTYAEPMESLIGEWKAMGTVFGLKLDIKSVSESEISFTIGNIYVGEEQTKTVDAVARKNGNKWDFETDELSGDIVLGVSCFWLNIQSAKDDLMDCRSYIFDFQEGMFS